MPFLVDADFWRRYSDRDLKRRLDVRQNLNKAKNVIVFVGDGMGIQTVTMARIYKGQKEGKSGEETELLWESFPSTGFSKVVLGNWRELEQTICP